MIDGNNPEHVHEFDAVTMRCRGCGEVTDQASAERAWELTHESQNMSTPSVEVMSLKAAFAEGKRAAEVPNVVIENPRNRKVVNTTLAVLGLVLACVTAADVSSTAFDLSAITEPAWAVYGILNGAFGIAVINSNIPKA